MRESSKERERDNEREIEGGKDRQTDRQREIDSERHTQR